MTYQQRQRHFTNETTSVALHTDLEQYIAKGHLLRAQAVAAMFRITSYNVCYTKLLRCPVVAHKLGGAGTRALLKHGVRADLGIVITSYSIHYTKLYDADNGSTAEGSVAAITKLIEVNRLPIIFGPAASGNFLAVCRIAQTHP